MLNLWNIPHPKMITNHTRKTQAKVWWMLEEIVIENEKKEEIEIRWIVELSKKFWLWDKTFAKYLKKSIFQSEWEKNNKKSLYLSSTDVILIKEIIYLWERYKNLGQAQKNIIRCLIAKLWRML